MPDDATSASQTVIRSSAATYPAGVGGSPRKSVAAAMPHLGHVNPTESRGLVPPGEFSWRPAATRGSAVLRSAAILEGRRGLAFIHSIRWRLARCGAPSTPAIRLASSPPTSMEKQPHPRRAYAERQNWTVVSVFQDAALSGVGIVHALPAAARRRGRGRRAALARASSGASPRCGAGVGRSGRRAAWLDDASRRVSQGSSRQDIKRRRMTPRRVLRLAHPGPLERAGGGRRPRTVPAHSPGGCHSAGKHEGPGSSGLPGPWSGCGGWI